MRAGIPGSTERRFMKENLIHNERQDVGGC